MRSFKCFQVNQKKEVSSFVHGSCSRFRKQVTYLVKGGTGMFNSCIKKNEKTWIRGSGSLLYIFISGILNGEPCLAVEIKVLTSYCVLFNSF